jgi:hypothetical protein
MANLRAGRYGRLLQELSKLWSTQRSRDKTILCVLGACFRQDVIVLARPRFARVRSVSSALLVRTSLRVNVVASWAGNTQHAAERPTSGKLEVKPDASCTTGHSIRITMSLTRPMLWEALGCSGGLPTL